ncbi:hypothetical protein ADUPG1_007175, partial [Aduncisulcus paluster]
GDNGTCVFNQLDSTAVCECTDAFVGSSCQVPCPLGDNAVPCSGHGKCELLGSSAICLCDQPHADYYDKYIGDVCQYLCPRYGDDAVCDDHGLCTIDDNSDQAVCSCESGYVGSWCQSQCQCDNDHGYCYESTPGSYSSQALCNCSFFFSANNHCSSWNYFHVSLIILVGLIVIAGIIIFSILCVRKVRKKNETHSNVNENDKLLQNDPSDQDSSSIESIEEKSE